MSEEEWSKTFQSGSQPAYTVSKLNGNTHHLRDPLKELKARIPVPSIPDELVGADREWVPLSAGRWKFREHITLTEGRATNILLQRLALITDAQDRRHISLMDNLGWSAVSAKGRSAAFALNQLLRRRMSLLVATGIQFLHPWVDTVRMPADYLSRKQ